MNTTTEQGSAREARLDAGAPDADAEYSTRAGVSRRERYVSTYAELSRHIQASGLLQRRYVYYWTKIIGLVAVFVAIWVVFALLGNSWYQLLVAAVLAIVLAQFGFLGHDAAHRQIFATHHWNEWTARVISGLFSGLSYRWWVTKHNRHHLNPNKEGADPDLAPGAFAFTPSAVQRRAGLGRRLARWQGYYFFPLLLLEGLALHVTSIQTIMRREPMKYRWCEAAFITARLGGYIAVLLIVLPPGKAAAFLGVQMGLFGLLLGGLSPRTTPACPSSRPTRRSTFCGVRC
jgi:fatty acid desaturase